MSPRFTFVMRTSDVPEKLRMNVIAMMKVIHGCASMKAVID